MVRRSRSFQQIDILNSTYKKYNSCNDLTKICKCKHYDISINYILEKNVKLQNNLPKPNESVSYGDFLLKNPKATKKERIQAIQRFYNKLC
jgi:hypothetical protein